MPPQSRYRARPRDRRQAMRSLTSLHESRVYSPENFWSPVQKDFCNNICHEPTFSAIRTYGICISAGQSAFAPENLTTLAHFSVSSAMNFPKATDDPGKRLP